MQPDTSNALKAHCHQECAASPAPLTSHPPLPAPTHRAGLVSSIEYGLGDERLDEQGDIWRPSEPDPSQDRECAAPFVLCPYRGRYTLEETTPDALHMQVGGGRVCGACERVLGGGHAGVGQMT